MGIDEAIARANEVDAHELAARREQQELDAKKEQIVRNLFRDFAERAKRSGVRPLTVTGLRSEPKFVKWGNRYVDVATGSAWIVRRYTREDYASYVSCFAVTEEGVGISAQIITDRQPWVLRISDSPGEGIHGPGRRPWEDAGKFEKDELKRVSDETSMMLAEALRELGAV